MKRDNRFKWILIIVFIVASGYYLYPTFKYYNLSDEVKNDPMNIEMVTDLERKAIKRGLDLQGGVRLLLEIQLPSLVEKLAINRDDMFYEIFNEAVENTGTAENDFLVKFEQAAQSRNVRLERYFDRDRRMDENSDVRPVMDYLRDEASDGVRQSLGILRNRVDQFGVAEPTIQPQGNSRVIVELPGVDDIQRAKELIGKTAQLDFRLLRPDATFTQLIDLLDKTLKGETIDSTTVASDSTQAEKPSPESTEVNISDLFGDSSATGTETATVNQQLFGEKPFTSLLTNIGDNRVRALEKNVAVINAILQRDDVKAALPTDSEFIFDADPVTVGDENYYELLLLNKDAALGGEVVTEAKVRINTGSDPSKAGQPEVLMEMNRQGSSEWSRITGANIGKRIAIVLDDKVMSAPVVNTRIPSGSSVIEGQFTMDDAKDLAIVLRTGSFKADMANIQENTVGPSLGADSIKKGTVSTMIGLICVAVFMVIYYKVSGTIADLALMLNILFVMAILAGFHATLTLPGIAGLILTIGMAVDANVLIFERIREELLTGKTVRAAIDSGYSRAFVTILDANVTTLITSIVLYQYGTGPIKGFALTLSIGILCSMFTAIVFTRALFDFFAGKFKMQSLSI